MPEPQLPEGVAHMIQIVQMKDGVTTMAVAGSPTLGKQREMIDTARFLNDMQAMRMMMGGPQQQQGVQPASAELLKHLPTRRG